MWDKLQAIEERYEDLGRRLCDPDVLADPEKLRTYSKEQADLEETVQTYREYKRVVSALREAKEMFEERLDEEMREWVKSEIAALGQRREELEAKLQILLLPRDPNDDKNVIVEIRGAAGGEEASLFAADLFRMYTRYAERQGWRVEMLDSHPTDLGGFKEVVFSVQGRGLQPAKI